MAARDVPPATADSWDSKSALDLVSSVNPKVKIPASRYLQSGRFPVIDQGQGAVAGFVEDAGLLHTEPLPVIVFGDHTRVWKFATSPFAVGADGTKLLAPKEAVDPRFCFYALSHAPMRALGYSRHFKLLREMLIPLPRSKDVQRKIAEILSSVDETIEKTEAVIAQLDVVKKAMLEELLTRGTQSRRLEPIAEEWRLGRVLPGITMKPEGWQLVRLTDVAKLESGHTPSRRHPEYWDGGVPWVSLHDTGALDGPEITETAQTVSDLGIANSSARLLPHGTVVFSRTATVGKATILGREMSTSQDFANYVCGPRVHNRYLMHLLRFMQTEWARLMAGSTHQTIYMPVFRDLQILLPEIGEQEQIAEAADAIEARIQAEHNGLVPLRAVKASLASELLSGTTRVQTTGAT